MTAYDFLKENKMLADSFSEDSMKAALMEDINNKSSLAMINSYLKKSEGPLPNKPCLVIDAGGTNLRFAYYNGREFEPETKLPMFGVGQHLNYCEFFDLFAKEIEKYDADNVGFCFSYPCEILPSLDGRVISLSKELKVEGIENKLLGEEINKRLKRKRRFAVLNDTVAAQLGSCADIGIILGTGFNICFTDKQSGTITDSECGLYSGLPEGRFDTLLKERINSPGCIAEKQISGAYLGKLIEITANEYFDRKIGDFDLLDVSEFLCGKGKLTNLLDESEQEDFRIIADALLDRAAARVKLFVACLCSDYINVSDKKSPNVLTAALEGSTVYKIPGFLEKVGCSINSIPGLSVKFADARGKLFEGCVRSLYFPK